MYSSLHQGAGSQARHPSCPYQVGKKPRHRMHVRNVSSTGHQTLEALCARTPPAAPRGVALPRWTATLLAVCGYPT